MPRFNEQERETISKTLMYEGEKLFSTFGLKKVTVDDLAEVANISKGSFYAFYQNKEHLFIEINFKLQSELFIQVENELKNKLDLSKEDLFVLGIKLLLQGFLKHPILMNINNSTWDYLKRKLPAEFFDQHKVDDGKMVDKFMGLGIQFTESYDFLVKLYQSIFLYLGEFNGDPDQERITDVIIKGIAKQIIVSEK